MRRVKVLKIFFVVLLFISFILYANFSLIKTFFIATLTFNIPILTIFLLALLVIYQSAIKLTMLAGTFGILAYKHGADLEFYLKGITKIMPATIAHMFNRRAKKGVIYFSEQEAKDVTEWLESQFFKEKGYTAFFVGSSLTLGLMGTFAGLLIAIDEMGRIILSFGGDNVDLGEIMTGFFWAIRWYGYRICFFFIWGCICYYIKSYAIYFNKKSNIFFRRCSRLDERKNY